MPIENPLLDALLTLAGGEKEVIVIHKSFVYFTGSLEAGSLLDQLLYWTPRARIGGGWIAKSDKELQEELMLSRYSVRKARETLEKMGIIETKKAQFAGAPTIHYRIKRRALTDAWQHWAAGRLSEIRQTDSGDCPISDKRLSEIGQTKGADCPKSDKRLSENGQTITEPTTEPTLTKNTTNTGPANAGSAPAPESPLTPSQAMFEALAQTCAWDIGLLTKDQRGALNQTGAKLRQLKGQRVTPADVLAFEGWWQANDWRGKKGESPRPDQVRAEWGRFRRWQDQQQQAEETRAAVLRRSEAHRQAEQQQAQADADTAPDLAEARRVWALACEELRGGMLQDAYATYIAPLVVLCPNGAFQLQAPTVEVLEWNEHRLRPAIERALESVAGRAVRVEFVSK